jgi:glyoxylase-like metal-dependent hydrolase (beta-lactamase superfamily II)
VPALPPSAPLHSPPPPSPSPARRKRARGRSLASTASSSARLRSPSSATVHSRSRPKRCGAIRPRTQEACSHPRSTRLGPVGLETNTILVNTGDKLLLIDAGCGVDKFQKTTGRLIGNLAAAGYAPGDIDMILLTHAHFDHLWGISDSENASLLFPSAEFVASETEVAFWSDPALTDKLPPAQQPRITRTNLKLASPRLRLIKPGAEVAPGVTTFDTPGHTPGHISVHIGSGREEMLLTGDVVVGSEVNFLHPEWPFGFDLDVPMGIKTRMAFLDRAAADRALVSSYHLPFPGFGHVVREGSGYHWLPADWCWTA